MSGNLPDEIWCSPNGKDEYWPFHADDTEFNGATKYTRSDIAATTTAAEDVREAIKYCRAAIDDCDAHGTRAKEPLSVELRVKMETLIQAAQSNRGVEEIKITDFNNIIDPDMPSFRNVGSIFFNRYPHGLRIVADTANREEGK